MTSGDPISIAAWSGEEGGDNEVGVQLLRARFKAGMIDVWLLEWRIVGLLLYRRGFKRRLDGYFGASGGVWQVKPRAGRAEKRLKEKVMRKSEPTKTTHDKYRRRCWKEMRSGNKQRI